MAQLHQKPTHSVFLLNTIETVGTGGTVTNADDDDSYRPAEEREETKDMYH